MAELHNHTQNAEKFQSALDKDASIYQERDERSSWVRFKELRGAAKRDFFFDYYAKPLAVILVLVIIAANIVYSSISAKTSVAFILAINSYGSGNSDFEEEYFENFLTEHEYDTKKTEISVTDTIYLDADGVTDSTSYASQQVLVTRFAANQVDLCFADEAYFETLASNEYIANLEEYLTAEELAALADDLVYVDVSDEDGVTYTIAAGVRLAVTAGWMGEMNWYTETSGCVVGLSVAPHDEEVAVELLRSILNYEAE